MSECTHRVLRRSARGDQCAACGEVIRLAHVPDPEPFCSICLCDGPDLRKALDGKLECADCRDLSPRSGRYSFDDTPKAAATPGGGFTDGTNLHTIGKRRSSR